MGQLDILISIVVLGFGFQFALMRMMWVSINTRLEKMDEKITDIDRRLCRLEGYYEARESILKVKGE